MSILNITKGSTEEEIEAKYNHLFHANSKANGGSLYIQSKIYRAKEVLDIKNGSSWYIHHLNSLTFN